MKIYTKKGDEGKTSLIGGTRVPKHDLRIEAYGTVDELNSHIGLMSTLEPAAEFRELLKHVQDNLFTIGSHLALEKDAHMKLPQLDQGDVTALEHSIDEQEQLLPPLKNFVLPGGHAANAHAHVARCVCRRAERAVVRLNEQVEVEAIILQYLNRLSDWLFVFGRSMSRITATEEIAWTPRKSI